MITQKRRDMPSVCFQCIEAFVITIGAINQNKIKIDSLAFGSLESLSFIWIGGETDDYEQRGFVRWCISIDKICLLLYIPFVMFKFVSCLLILYFKNSDGYGNSNSKLSKRIT